MTKVTAREEVFKRRVRRLAEAGIAALALVFSLYVALHPIPDLFSALTAASIAVALALFRLSRKECEHDVLACADLSLIAL